jgi:hypothetical protein
MIRRLAAWSWAMRIAQALDRVGLAFEQHALDADQIAGQENHDDLPAAILDQAGPRDPTGVEQVDRSAVLAGVDQHVALAVTGRRPHSLPNRRFATDQHLAELRTVKRKTNIRHYLLTYADAARCGLQAARAWMTRASGMLIVGTKAGSRQVPARCRELEPYLCHR